MNEINSNFGFEVDFLPVGNGERSGDAICLRWGYNLDTPSKRSQIVCVIDGGYKENGDDIVNHLNQYHATDTVHYVINTHPDNDHVGGLHTVIEKCKVHNLIIHCPWMHPRLRNYFDDCRVTDNSIRKHLHEGLDVARTLVDKAREKDICVTEPFAPKKLFEDLLGVTAYVLGPTQEYYHQLLPSFRSTPTSNNDSVDHRLENTERMVPTASCPLTDEGETSAENNSSVILAFKLPNNQIFLFTGDAGMPALSNAVDLASQYKLNLSQHIRLFQVPHHGSIQNLGPSVLDSIFTPPQDMPNENPIAAYISVSKDPSPLHPSKHVINALIERKVNCYQTHGRIICHTSGSTPNRTGWTRTTPEPYYELVEYVE